MRIGIDLDGVVFDSETTFRTYEEIFDINYLNGNNLVNREQSKHQQRYNWTKEQEKEFVNKFYLKVSSESGLMSGFKAVYELLRQNPENEFVVITARGHDIKAMKDDAERILNENNIKFDTYFWAIRNKLEICKQEKTDLMIDDDWRIIEILAENQIKTLYFRDANLKILPKNKYITEVNNWGDIYRYFTNINNNK